MVLVLTTEFGTASAGDRFTLPGGCETGGWFHLSDIRRNRHFRDDCGYQFWTVDGVSYREAFYESTTNAM